MKRVTVFLATLFSFTIYAQPIDTTVTDCNNNSKSIYATLSTGKSIIIAHEGVDCSICQSQAASLQSWAAANKSKVEVWCALTWKYNPATFSPACTATNNWVNQYNWNDIFTFPDHNRAWYSNGTPRYYVYSPNDCTLVFAGGKSQAETRALQESTVGIQELPSVNGVKVATLSNGLFISSIPHSVSRIEIYNSKGELIKEIDQPKAEVKVNGFNTGVYFIQLMDQSRRLTSRKAFIP